MVSLESVAMTDIVLNMFIFFFISFSLIYTFNPTRAQKIEVKLPQAQNVRDLGESDQIDITLTQEGPVYLDKEIVSMKNLSSKLKQRVSSNPSLNVVIRSDRLVPFKTVVSILDIVSGSGIKNVSIAAVKE